MPRIIVLAECRYAPRGRVVLEERVVTAHFESDHTSAQLVERVGWTIVDADELERADTGTPAHRCTRAPSVTRSWRGRMSARATERRDRRSMSWTVYARAATLWKMRVATHSAQAPGPRC